jgi:hypothetical protein
LKAILWEALAQLGFSVLKAVWEVETYFSLIHQ